MLFPNLPKCTFELGDKDENMAVENMFMKGGLLVKNGSTYKMRWLCLNFQLLHLRMFKLDEYWKPFDFVDIRLISTFGDAAEEQKERRSGQSIRLGEHSTTDSNESTESDDDDDDDDDDDYGVKLDALNEMETGSAKSKPGSGAVGELVRVRKRLRTYTIRAYTFPIVTPHHTYEVAALSADERALWIRALTLATENARLTRIDQVALQAFQSADIDQSGKLDFGEVTALCRSMGIQLKKDDIRHAFDVVDVDANGMLDFSEFCVFLAGLRRRPEVVEIFNAVSGGEAISVPTLYDWLKSTQRQLSLSIEDVYALVRDCEANYVPEGRDTAKEPTLSMDGFHEFMASERWNAAADPNLCTNVYQVMEMPLAAYWIKTAHRAFLDADGRASATAIQKCLERAYRCIDLCVWDGDDGAPVVAVSRAAQSQLRVARALHVVRKYAFVASDYPLLLALEIYCDENSQTQLVASIQDILGDMLASPRSEWDRLRLPSPRELTGKIVLIAKVRRDANTSECEDSEEEDEEDEGGANGSVLRKSSIEKKTAARKRTGSRDKDGYTQSNVVRSGAGRHLTQTLPPPPPPVVTSDTVDTLDVDDVDMDTDAADDEEAVASHVRRRHRKQSPDTLTSASAPSPVLGGGRHGNAPATRRKRKTSKEKREKRERDAEKRLSKSSGKRLLSPKRKSENNLLLLDFGARQRFEEEERERRHDESSEEERASSSRSRSPRLSPRDARGSASKRTMGEALAHGMVSIRTNLRERFGSRIGQVPTPSLTTVAHVRGVSVLSDAMNALLHFSYTQVPGGVHLFDSSDLTEMHALSERRVHRVLDGDEERTRMLCVHTRTHLLKVHPHAQRVDGNFPPLDAWSCGCQLVALRATGASKPMWVHAGHFGDNGGCGYVLKPSTMSDVSYNPLSVAPTPHRILTVRVICAWKLPKPHGGTHGEIIDPFVDVRVYGAAIDTKKYQTQVVRNNGYHPVFDDKFDFPLRFPEFAVLFLRVMDKDIGSKNDFIGELR